MAARQYSELAQCMTSAVCEFRFHLTMSMMEWNRSSHQTLQGWKTIDQSNTLEQRHDGTAGTIEWTNERTIERRYKRMNVWTYERMNDRTIERSNDRTIERLKRTNSQNDQANERTNKGTKRTKERNSLKEGDKEQRCANEVNWIERESSWSNLDTRNRGVTYSVHVQIYICVLVHIYRT